MSRSHGRVITRYPAPGTSPIQQAPRSLGAAARHLAQNWHDPVGRLLTVPQAPSA